MRYFKTIDFDSGKYTRRKLRTISEAMEITAPLRLRGKELEDAETRILRAKQPKAEARRIVKSVMLKRAIRKFKVDDELDHSDVQELRVKFIRKNGYLFPSDPQALPFNRMDREIAEGKMTPKRFQEQAAAAMNMKVGSAERKIRKDEAKLLRQGWLGGDK
jgi:hypothetical protein